MVGGDTSDSPPSQPSSNLNHSSRKKKKKRSQVRLTGDLADQAEKPPILPSPPPQIPVELPRQNVRRSDPAHENPTLAIDGPGDQPNNDQPNAVSTPQLDHLRAQLHDVQQKRLLALKSYQQEKLLRMSTTKDMEETIAGLRDTVLNLERRISSQESTLGEINGTDANSEKLDTPFVSKVDALEKELRSLKQKLDNSENARRADASEHSKQVETIRRTLHDSEERRRAEALESAKNLQLSNSKLMDVSADFSARIDDLTQARDDAKLQLSSALQSHETTLAAQASKSDCVLREAQAQYEDKLSEANLAARAALAEKDSIIATLLKDLEDAMNDRTQAQVDAAAAREDLLVSEAQRLEASSKVDQLKVDLEFERRTALTRSSEASKIINSLELKLKVEREKYLESCSTAEILKSELARLQNSQVLQQQDVHTKADMIAELQMHLDSVCKQVLELTSNIRQEKSLRLSAETKVSELADLSTSSAVEVRALDQSLIDVQRQLAVKTRLLVDSENALANAKEELQSFAQISVGAEPSRDGNHEIRSTVGNESMQFPEGYSPFLVSELETLGLTSPANMVSLSWWHQDFTCDTSVESFGSESEPTPSEVLTNVTVTRVPMQRGLNSASTSEEDHHRSFSLEAALIEKTALVEQLRKQLDESSAMCRTLVDTVEEQGERIQRFSSAVRDQ